VTHKYREIITSDVHYHRKLAVSWLRSCTCPTCRVRLDTRMIKDLVEGVGSFVSDHTIEMLKALDLGSRHANDPEMEAVEGEEGPSRWATTSRWNAQRSSEQTPTSGSTT
jgi:hypothetical protein